MRNIDVEEILINLMQATYRKMKSAVRFDKTLTEWFTTKVGNGLR